tara:strand:+ start:605 stop:754 length:150 start_codon:yes stop_codon:yes gene_type:complete
MKHSGVCVCGYETPPVENEEDIDWDLIHAHQEFCPLFRTTHRIEKEEEE